MRSLLIAPAHEQKLAEALESGADAIIVDLAQAAPAERAGAREASARFLKYPRRRGPGPVLIVRIDPPDSGETDADLDALLPGAPDAIMLSGSLGAASVQQLSAKLAVREAQIGLAEGETRIIAIVETAQSLFTMQSYRGSSARLIGIAWGAESLRADIGAETDRNRPRRLPRRLSPGARAYAARRDVGAGGRDRHRSSPTSRTSNGLRAEALAARREGFTGKIALDPAQVGIINDVFAARLARLARESPS